jgi:hypothetical protein
MAISVLCQGCQTRFEVSDKFAGKKGPCPKCKAIITVPEVSAAEVKIHVPEEFASGGKDRQGRMITKPIPRKDAKFNPRVAAAVLVGTALTLAVAIVGRSLEGGAKYGLIAVGLLLLGPPVAAAGYAFLRNDELEPHRGRELWVRSALCGLGYAVLWGMYWYASGYLSGEVYQWVFVAPVFIAAGGGLAMAAFDLDFTSGALHYSFYLFLTLVLRAVVGLEPVWQSGGLTL